MAGVTTVAELHQLFLAEKRDRQALQKRFDNFVAKFAFYYDSRGERVPHLAYIKKIYKIKDKETGKEKTVADLALIESSDVAYSKSPHHPLKPKENCWEPISPTQELTDLFEALEAKDGSSAKENLSSACSPARPGR